MSLTDEWQGEPLPFQNKHTGHVYSIRVYKNLLPFVNVKWCQVMVREMTGKTVHQKFLPGKTLEHAKLWMQSVLSTDQSE